MTPLLCITYLEAARNRAVTRNRRQLSISNTWVTWNTYTQLNFYRRAENVQCWKECNEVHWNMTIYRSPYLILAWKKRRVWRIIFEAPRQSFARLGPSLFAYGLSCFLEYQHLQFAPLGNQKAKHQFDIVWRSMSWFPHVHIINHNQASSMLPWFPFGSPNDHAVCASKMTPLMRFGLVAISIGLHPTRPFFVASWSRTTRCQRNTPWMWTAKRLILLVTAGFCVFGTGDFASVESKSSDTIVPSALKTDGWIGHALWLRGEMLELLTLWYVFMLFCPSIPVYPMVHPNWEWFKWFINHWPLHDLTWQ